jgi:uncharacterized protein (TIGR03086 family)
MSPLDFDPAVRRMVALVEVIGVDALERPTPCREYSLGDLLEHVDGFAVVFRAAAVKEPIDRAPSGNAADLPADWPTRIPDDLRALASAWKDPEAWTGTTAAAGVDLPGEVAGVIALDEVVLHGWDVAKAVGKPAGYDGPGLPEIFDQVTQFRSAGVEGLFGPEVPVPHDAPLFDRVLGVTGRDPDWEP